MIRCLLSALIVQWENFRGEDRAKNFPKQLALSINLIILLKKVRVHRLIPSSFHCDYSGSISSNTIE